MANEVYNVSAVINNSGNFLEFAQQVDGSILPSISMGLIVLIIVFVVLFMSMMSRGISVKNSLVASLFINGFIAIMLRAMGLLTDKWWFVSLILFGGLILVLFMTEK